MAIMATKRKVIVENEGSSDEDYEAETQSHEEEMESDKDSVSNDDGMQEDESNKESDSNDDATQEDDQTDATGNLGWADSIAKILKANKPKGKKTLVLSKAKKLTDVRKARIKDAGYEVEAQDGKVKREQVQASDSEEEKEAEQPVRKKKKELPSLRVKPNILEKDRERTLSKIATKGVVQLFNAVKKQQKDIDTKLQDAGPLEVKRDKVMKSIDKREFLNVLMGDKSKAVKAQLTEGTTVQIRNKVNKEEPTWSVLRDDFMMGAKMKDWDKELEEEEENEVENNIVESE